MTRPSAAPDDLPADDARDDDTAAAAIDAAPPVPGGGALRGGAADPGATGGRGTAPGAPIDTRVDPGDVHAADDAKGAAAGRNPWRGLPRRPAIG